MSSISHNGDSISYTYDPDGIRTSKTVNGTTTKYHVMNGTLLGQTKGSDTIVFLYDEKGNKYGFDYNGTKYYYIFNVQGDVIGILNQSGSQIVSYQYDPWGKVLSVDGSEASTIGQLNPIRYRGYYYDTETGFYYLQSRYYDPTVKRFLNVDSQLAGTAQVQGYNLFAYCLNNPVNFSDPTGHWPDWGTLLGGVVTVLVGVAAVAAVVGTGGAATPLVALGLASIGAAGLGTIGFGCSEIVESFTGQNPIRNAIGSSAYDTAKTASTLISAGGASWIASSPYLGNSSSSAPKAGFVNRQSSNNIPNIQNDVLSSPRIGSALKVDPYHAFNDIIDNYAGYASKFSISNGTLYQLPGSLNGVSGRFEWIIQNGNVTHRLFVKGGEINGIPIMP